MDNNSNKQDAIYSSPIFLIALSGLFSINAISLDTTIIAIPSIATNFGVVAGQAQLVTVFFLLGYSLAHIPIGLLGDRFGRRPVILIGLGIGIVLSVFAIFAWSIEVLIWLRFFQGVTTCAAGLLARAIIRDVASGAKASQLSSKALSILSALIIVLPLLSAYVIHLFDWRAVFLIVSLILLLIWILAFIFIPETKPESTDSHNPWQQFKSSFVAFIRSPQSIIASMLGGIAFGTYFIFTNVGSSLVVDFYNRPASLFGLVFAFSAFIMVLVSVFNIRYVHRWGTSVILRIALGMSVFGIGLCLYYIFVDDISLAMLVFVSICFACTHVLVLPNSIALTLDPLPKTAGFAAAIHGTFQAGIAGLIGLVVSHFYNGEVQIVLFLYAVFAALTVATFFAGRKMFLFKR